MVSLAFPRAVRQVAVHLDEEIKAGSSLLIKSGGRQDGETAVCLEDEDGGLFQYPVGFIRWITEEVARPPVRGSRPKYECFGRRLPRAAEAPRRAPPVFLENTWQRNPFSCRSSR